MQLATWLRRRARREPEEPPCVLLVDTDRSALDAQRSLLAGQFPVETAQGAIEVFGMEPQVEPGTVVLNQRLGPRDLEAVAEYARHRWPQARILVMTAGEPPLEDHLYDETAIEDCSYEDLLRAIHQCARMRQLNHRR
jgi:DNA-binding NtrC family response regulator